MRIYTGTPAAVSVRPPEWTPMDPRHRQNPWGRTSGEFFTHLDDVFTPVASWDEVDLDLLDHAPIRPTLRPLATEWDDLSELNVALGHLDELPKENGNSEAADPEACARSAAKAKATLAARGTRRGQKPGPKPPRPFPTPLGPETRPIRGSLPPAMQSLVAEWAEVERQLRPLYHGECWDEWIASVVRTFRPERASSYQGRLKWAMLQLRRSA